MPAYLVSTVRVTDPARFQAYTAKIAGLGEKYGAEYVVRGAVTDMLEGDGAPGERVVVARFPDEAAVRAYLSDPLYLEGKAARAGAATVQIRLVVV